MATLNLNDTTPAAPGGHTNVAWQKSGTSISANIPTAPSGAQLVPTLPADATKYLDGTGAFTVPAGGGGGGDSITVDGTGGSGGGDSITVDGV